MENGPDNIADTNLYDIKGYDPPKYEYELDSLKPHRQQCGFNQDYEFYVDDYSYLYYNDGFGTRSASVFWKINSTKDIKNKTSLLVFSKSIYYTKFKYILTYYYLWKANNYGFISYQLYNTDSKRYYITIYPSLYLHNNILKYKFINDISGENNYLSGGGINTSSFGNYDRITVYDYWSRSSSPAYRKVFIQTIRKSGESYIFADAQIGTLINSMWSGPIKYI